MSRPGCNLAYRRRRPSEFPRNPPEGDLATEEKQAHRSLVLAGTLWQAHFLALVGGLNLHFSLLSSKSFFPLLKADAAAERIEDLKKLLI